MRESNRTTNPALQPVVLAEFARLAQDGVIGAPDGKPAYAYIRVSSDKQAQEGHSGLPRQLEHCGEIAAATGHSIRLDMLYADDFTGFDVDRPALDRLRAEVQNGKRADVLICENADRLGRDETIAPFLERHFFEKFGVKVVYWDGPDDDPTLRAMKAVFYAHKLREDRARMVKGNRDKAAKDKRINGRKAAYGFQFVDSHGNPGPAAIKDTHYGIVEHEAVIVRDLFARLAAGQSQTGVARDFNALYKPPRNMKTWTQSMVARIAENPAYKGKYVTNRQQRIGRPKKGENGQFKTAYTNKLRPESEWIYVDCPAIVSPELWAAANNSRLRRQNQIMARRNAKHDFLLTGLIKCACCGQSVTGRATTLKHTRKNGAVSTYRRAYYRCLTRQKSKWQRDVDCTNPQIGVQTLETAVWAVILNAVLDPKPLIDALREELETGPNSGKLAQIAFLLDEIEKAELADSRDHDAYLAGYVTLDEFGAKRQARKSHIAAMRAECERLGGQVTTVEQFEAHKAALLAVSAQARAAGLGPETDFETRRNVIKLLVNQIDLDVSAGVFTLRGVINGLYTIGNRFDRRSCSSLWPPSGRSRRHASLRARTFP